MLFSTLVKEWYRVVTYLLRFKIQSCHGTTSRSGRTRCRRRQPHTVAPAPQADRSAAELAAAPAPSDAAAHEQPSCSRGMADHVPDRSAFRGLPDELLRRLLAEACSAWPLTPLWGLLAACRVCWRFRDVLAAHPLPAVLRLGSGSGLPEAAAAATEAQAAWLRALAAEHGAPLKALVLGTGVSPKTGAVHVLLGFVVGDSEMLQQLRAWPVRLAVELNPEPAAAACAAALDLSSAKLTLLRVANPTPNPAAVDARWLPRALRSLDLELLHADACTALVDLAEWARRLPALDRMCISAAAEKLALRVGARPGVRLYVACAEGDVALCMPAGVSAFDSAAAVHVRAASVRVRIDAAAWHEGALAAMFCPPTLAEAVFELAPDACLVDKLFVQAGAEPGNALRALVRTLIRRCSGAFCFEVDPAPDPERGVACGRLSWRRWPEPTTLAWELAANLHAAASEWAKKPRSSSQGAVTPAPAPAPAAGPGLGHA